MAAVTQEEQQAVQPQEAAEETPQESAADALQENKEETTQEASEPPKERRSILLPVLTVLLILLGISEAVFWGYFGLSAYARSLARERYEQQQKAIEEEQAGIFGGSSYSPNLKVENGTVIWERENRGYAGNSQAANTSTTPRREDGLRLSRLSVVRVPYTLAEMDEDFIAPTPETGSGETAPTGT